MDTEKTEAMPLNKYLAHAGIASRRNAIDIIKNGDVTVNGKQILEPGFKVGPNDQVIAYGKQLTNQKNFVYILLNKPTNTITTTEDPEGRPTVMDVVRDATNERVYPIGRLDWNTTGVLILTNDGQLTQRLSHPSFEVRKMYTVTLDRPFAQEHYQSMIKGLYLDDGLIEPDEVNILEPNVISVQIHSGRNRIVRRMFEYLGYDIIHLDRVMFANITKGSLRRGEWRLLTEKEVSELYS
jgi:23S rRNA pseudouridine2605 synthase